MEHQYIAPHMLPLKYSCVVASSAAANISHACLLQELHKQLRRLGHALRRRQRDARQACGQMGAFLHDQTIQHNQELVPTLLLVQRQPQTTNIAI